MKNSLKRGFSLIEMLVAVSLFATSATISIGTILAVSEAQQKVLSLRIVQDNLSYVFDTMTKEIRTGTSFHCGWLDDFSASPADCVFGGDSFTFKNSDGGKITYQAKNNRIERIFEGGGPAQAILVLTAPEAIITNLKFYVRGALPVSSSDYYQPRVTFILQGQAGLKERIRSNVNIQTTISQRTLDS